MKRQVMRFGLPLLQFPARKPSGPKQSIRRAASLPKRGQSPVTKELLQQCRSEMVENGCDKIPTIPYSRPADVLGLGGFSTAPLTIHRGIATRHGFRWIADRVPA